MMDPRQFLTALWGENPPGMLNIFMLPDQKSYWYPDLEKVNRDMQQHLHEEVYTGVALAKKEGTRFNTRSRVKEVDAAAIPGVWADIDVFHPSEKVHKEKSLPSTVEQAQEVMAKLPHSPTLIVDSGHGLQYWWLLEEPWVFKDQGEWEQARRMTQWWHRITRELFDAMGWTTDSVFDLSRIMRLPGTFNNKIPEERKEVTVIKADGPRYSLNQFIELVPEDFAASAPAPEDRRGRRGRASQQAASTTSSGLILDPNAEPKPVRLNSLLKADVRFMLTWEHHRPDLKDQSASSYDMSIANVTMRAGWPQQETVNAMICWRRMYGCDLKLREDYYARTLDRAKESIEKGSERPGDRDSSHKAAEEAPPQAGRSSGNRKRRTPEDWMAAWPEGLDPLVKQSTQWEGPCPSCSQETGDGGDDRFHVNVAAPHQFGCRKCVDPKTEKPDMRPYYAVFGRHGGARDTGPSVKEGGGTFFRIGDHIGQSLRPTWRYLDRAEGPTWARFQDGCWQEMTTQDRSLIGFISANRFRIAGELEEAGWPEGAAALGNDRLWDRQKHVGSDLWDGLRKACWGQVPESLQYHVGVKNGCVDLVTGELHPHHPECGQRGLAAGRYLPADWERLSKVAAAHLAPVFTPETQRAYLELIGLSLTGEAATYRGLVLIQGKARSGKGGAVRLQRAALGQRSAAINADWFSRRASDIDAETANILHRRYNSIATSELGLESLPHRKKVLAALGGEDELSARRPHGATVTAIITALWWSSCVDLPKFDVGDGMAERLAVLRTIAKLSPRVKKPESRTFTQDLMDAVITGAILAIRDSGFFDASPASYVAPGGPGDAATAAGLAEMDALADWLETLPDSWDGALVEEARAQAQDYLGEEISATRFGTHIQHSERWDKRRQMVDGDQRTRLFLAEGCRVADSAQGFSDLPAYIPNKPDGNPATLQPGGAADVAKANAEGPEVQSTADDETGDLPYHGPEPQICRKHTQALVGEGCPACYREWSEAQSAAEAVTMVSEKPERLERCRYHMYPMTDGICEICVHEDVGPDDDDYDDRE